MAVMKEQRRVRRKPPLSGPTARGFALAPSVPEPPSVDWAAMSEPERFRIREVLRTPEIRAAMLGTFVIMLGFGILAPVLPNYARSFGVGYDSVGLLISAFSFARLVSDPFVGKYI